MTKTWAQIAAEIEGASSADEQRALFDDLFAAYLADPRATTPSGLPYPAPTDPIAQGADAIRNLAQALETPRVIAYALTSGSGVTLPGTASFTAIPFATLSFPVTAGQKYVIRAVVTVVNAASGNSKTATVRLVENGVAMAPSIQNTFSSLFVVGSSASSCQIAGPRTAAAAGTIKYDLQGYANAASSVTIAECELSAISIP
jgi:hypothetical protein